MTASTGAATTAALSAQKQRVLDLILKAEGGYAERALEGGGAVNMGITFTVFRAWRRLQGKPDPTFADLKVMTLAEAEQIYAQEMFAPIRFLDLPAGVDYALADSATNNGVGGMFRFLGAATGHPGERHMSATLLWAARRRDPAALVNAFCDARAAGQKHFKNYPVRIRPDRPRTWGDAWDERNEKVRKTALAMIAEQKEPTA